LRGSLGSFASPAFAGFAFVASLEGMAILPFFFDPACIYTGVDTLAVSSALNLKTKVCTRLSVTVF
jgi:hypothetical protein